MIVEFLFTRPYDWKYTISCKRQQTQPVNEFAAQMGGGYISYLACQVVATRWFNW
jgi:hypothetical protein